MERVRLDRQDRAATTTGNNQSCCMKFSFTRPVRPEELLELERWVARHGRVTRVESDLLKLRAWIFFGGCYDEAVRARDDLACLTINCNKMSVELSVISVMLLVRGPASLDDVSKWFPRAVTVTAQGNHEWLLEFEHFEDALRASQLDTDGQRLEFEFVEKENVCIPLKKRKV